jgi:phosphoribosyl 1,2-cyclic phosphodiesterase
MSDLVVRAYNVGFGDAVLVSIREADHSGNETIRHLLIDVGNLLVGAGNEDSVFNDVVTDIKQRIGGNSVDLYVMTHEHMDHVQ